MNDSWLIALTLASLEVVPADPSDLVAVLEDHVQRDALVRMTPDEQSSELTGYLCSELDLGRVQQWRKRLQMLADTDPVTAVLTGSADYPQLLGQCWDRPPLLFIRGKLHHARPALAIVGSRAAGPSTLEAAELTAATMATRGISIVSGLAAGVDTAAHRGALAADGHTVAVLGTGIRRVFPEGNDRLAAEIAATGAVVSQFEPHAPRTATSFLRRNNVIAGLSHASLVMDGQERSGSRHQAEQAVRYGRPVYLWAPTLRGQRWAAALQDAGSARFIADPDEITDLASEVH